MPAPKKPKSKEALLAKLALLEARFANMNVCKANTCQDCDKCNNKK
jgi:hypothetical protein